MGKYHMISDKPILTVGSWRLLGPDKHGIAAGQLRPLLVHKCPKEFSHLKNTKDEEIRYTQPDRSDGQPKCKLCYDPVPEEIQGLLAMYHWEEA